MTIKDLMTENGMTITDVTKATGLTRQTIYNIINGKIENSKVKIVLKLAECFGVEFEDLV